jgi:G3E family GTPase
MLLPDYRVDGVVCVVDAENGFDTLDAHPVSVKQVAVADRLLVSKLDIAAPAKGAALRVRLAAINPRAAAIPVLNGEIDPAQIVDLGSLTGFGAEAVPEDGTAPDGHRCGPDCDHDHDHAQHQAHDHGHAVHDHEPGEAGALHGEDGIASFVVTREHPVMLQKLEQALEKLATAHAERMLRIKGIVNVEGRPVVIQGVQHLFHPPVLLPKWPSGDRRTRLVFIVRDIDPSVVHAALADI